MNPNTWEIWHYSDDILVPSVIGGFGVVKVQQEVYDEMERKLAVSTTRFACKELLDMGVIGLYVPKNLK